LPLSSIESQQCTKQFWSCGLIGKSEEICRVFADFVENYWPINWSNGNNLIKLSAICHLCNENFCLTISTFDCNSPTYEIFILLMSSRGPICMDHNFPFKVLLKMHRCIWRYLTSRNGGNFSKSIK
jgi:hypothetical protein